MPRFRDISRYCSRSASRCLISPRLPHAHVWLFGVEAPTRACVCARALVCCRRWANEEEVSASLQECVVSEDPISLQPQAWLQGLRRTASTDKFVSVIKPCSVARAGTRQTRALNRSRAPAFYTKNEPFMSTAAHRFTALISAARRIVTVTERAALKQLSLCARPHASVVAVFPHIWRHHVG